MKYDFLSSKTIWMVCYSILTFLFIFSLNDCYLRKIENLSLFIPDRQYFTDCMQMPGGLLVYGGNFLTQFFHYPLLGTCVYVLLLITLTWGVIKIYRIPDRFFLWAMLPGMMFVLSLSQLGYLIYNLKSSGSVYVGMLGVMTAGGILWGYRMLGVYWSKVFMIFLVALVGYPLLGFYALLGLCLCLVYEVGKRKKRYLLSVLLMLFCILVIPWLLVIIGSTQMSISQIYIAGLPDFKINEEERILWLPFVVIGICMFFNLIFLLRSMGQQGFSGYVLLCWVGSWGIVYGFSFREKNFQLEVEMDYAMRENNWEKVVELGQKTNKQPSRLMVMNRNLALWKLGKAGDQMFHYENESQVYKPRRHVLMLGAKALYWHYGKVNFCYRWCMEDMVVYGMRAEDLQYMVKCALINGECALAQKYNDVLKKTWFYRDWANQYQVYIDSPDLVSQHKEFQAIQPLLAYDNVPEGDGNQLEVYLLNHFANMEGGTPQLVELSLQCNLILKNIANFWPRFFLYLRSHDRLPVHYQEAAVLYAQLEGEVDISRLPIEERVKKRFEEFLILSQNYAGFDEKHIKGIFEKRFKNTFWYYYFFVKGGKTT